MSKKIITVVAVILVVVIAVSVLIFSPKAKRSFLCFARFLLPEFSEKLT